MNDYWKAWRIDMDACFPYLTAGECSRAPRRIIGEDAMTACKPYVWHDGERYHRIELWQRWIHPTRHLQPKEQFRWR